MNQKTKTTPKEPRESMAARTLMALAKYNSWRRGDDAFEMPSPAEIGASIDDAVNLLREHDIIEREVTRLHSALESLAYWSRSRTETRVTLRNRIAAILSPDNKPSPPRPPPC
jgi:MoxR-like ATPase